MERIDGVTFAPFARKGTLAGEEAKRSLAALKERMHANTVLLVPGGLQKTAQSETISFAEGALAGDDELKAAIEAAHALGLRVFLKPTVNCENGVWRAYISFFDEDVPCEPKWSNWFSSYAAFQRHYAAIAAETGCEMFIAGCEMVMSEHRSAEWRGVIDEIRRFYRGPVSYNTDKYQEHRVLWWDALDVISSSGYYPITDWERELDRIETVVKRFDKPFFFAETGCMSTAGSSLRPNDWSVRGDLALREQADWYETMFGAIRARSWVDGCALWSWSGQLSARPGEERGYEVYGKPAEAVVAKYFGENGVTPFPAG